MKDRSPESNCTRNSFQSQVPPGSDRGRTCQPGSITNWTVPGEADRARAQTEISYSEFGAMARMRWEVVPKTWGPPGLRLVIRRLAWPECVTAPSVLA